MGLFDDYWNWGTQVGSDVFGGFYDAFNDPRLQAQKDLASNPYIPGYSPLKEYGESFVSGIGNLFDLINKPVNIATAAASGLPYTDPSFTIPNKGDLAGGSLRDLASEGLLLKTLVGDVSTPGYDKYKIENPYLLTAIEKIGGETLDELADPTNIPGALVGAGGMLGRGASELDKLISAGGAVSGLGEGLPGLGKSASSIWNEGLNPENFGQGLESLIAAGFGGLSGVGLNADSPTIKPEVPVMTDSQVYDLVARNLPESTLTPEESLLDEKIFENLVRQEKGLPSIPYLESLITPELSIGESVVPEVDSSFRLGNQIPLTTAPEISVEDIPFITEESKTIVPEEIKIPETLESIIDIPSEDVSVVAEPITPKEELSSFVNALKNKYGDNWRKKMTTDENIEFRDKQLNVQGKSKTGRWFSDNFEDADSYARARQGETLYVDVPKDTYIPTFEGRANTFVLPQEIVNASKPLPKDAETGLYVEPELKEGLKRLYRGQEKFIPPSNVPPTIETNNVNVEKPEPPSKKLQSLSIAERTTLPTLRNLTKASPEIGTAVKAYDDYHTELASENIADVRRITKGVNKAGEQKIIRFLDGEDIKLDSHELRVAKELRRTLDNIANLAGQNDVLVGYREGYFPRKYEDRFEWDISPRAFDSKNKPVGALEKSRERNNLNFRRDFKVLEEYINEASRRISEAKYLGKSLENVTGKKFSGDRPTVEFIEKAIAKVTGREASSTPARFADRLRKITALGDLGLAVIYQPAQFAHTASAVGIRRATRAVFKALSNGSAEVQNATRSGALWPSISHEVSRAIGDKGYMHLIPTMDKVMRVHANVAGRILAQDALRGNSYAKRQLDSLGIKLDDPKLFDRVGKAIADKTQFRTGTLDLPLWAHSPLGKLTFQYSSFAYAQAKFAHDMLKHPVRNFGQIVRFAAMGALLGEGAADLREMLRAIIPGKDEEDDIVRRMLEAAAGDESFDDKTWLKKLQAVTRSKRIPTSSPAWRTIQNLSMAGGVGIFQNVAEKATSGKFWQLPLGPAGSMLVDTGEAARSDLQKGIEKGDWKFDSSLRNIVQNLPLPLVSNRKLADVVVPKKSRKAAKDPFDFDIDFKDIKFDF